jgi:hypothetical protein
METSQSALEQKHEGEGEDQGEYEVNLTENLQDRNSAEGKFAWRSAKQVNQDTFHLQSGEVYKEAYHQFE